MSLFCAPFRHAASPGTSGAIRVVAALVRVVAVLLGVVAALVRVRLAGLAVNRATVKPCNRGGGVQPCPGYPVARSG